jgi:hypothetical protein
MAVILNASTSSGFVQSADTSGVVQIQNNGTTRLEANGTGVVVTGTGSVSGNFTASGDLLFNSGYGSAAIGYGCRAWVNFNGITNAIRASGNISSITDDGTGIWTLNFTNAMPDANYCLVSSAQVISSQTTGRNTGYFSTDNDGTGTVVSTTQCKVASRGSSYQETFYITFAVIR